VENGQRLRKAVEVQLDAVHYDESDVDEPSTDTTASTTPTEEDPGTLRDLGPTLLSSRPTTPLRAVWNGDSHGPFGVRGPCTSVGDRRWTRRWISPRPDSGSVRDDLAYRDWRGHGQRYTADLGYT
jgi:hypothetical protein